MSQISDGDVEAIFVESLKFCREEARPYYPYYAIFESVLHDDSLPDASAKATKIANDVKEKLDSMASDGEKSLGWTNFMFVVADCMTQFVPDHIYQDALVESLKKLRQFPGPLPKKQYYHLPDLQMHLIELGENPFHYYDPKLVHHDALKRNIIKWLSVTSFAARMMLPDLGANINPAIHAGHDAFEEPPKEGVVMDMRLWAATEWILRCGEIWMPILTEDHEVKRGVAVALALGSLLEDSDMHVFGKARFEFWRKKLVEFQSDWEKFRFEETTKERVERTVQKLDHLLATGTFAW